MKKAPSVYWGTFDPKNKPQHRRHTSIKHKHIRKQNQRIQQIQKLAQYDGIGQINAKYSNLS